MRALEISNNNNNNKKKTYLLKYVLGSGRHAKKKR